MAKAYTRKGQIANGVAIKPLNEGERNVSALAKGGAGGGVLVVGTTIDGNTVTLDKTWQEIYECDIPVLNERSESFVDFDSAKITHAEYDHINQYYYVTLLVNKNLTTGEYQNSINLTTPTADGYPSATKG